MKYEDCYVRTVDEQTLWLVKDGVRTKIVSIEALQDFGMKPVHMVSEAVLSKIPLAGEGKKK